VTRKRVASISDLPAGSLRRLVVRGEPVCLAHARDGTVYAVSDICSHEEASLSEGELLGREIECPLHVSRFDLRTGSPVAPPATLSIKTYRVTVEGDDVYIEE